MTDAEYFWLTPDKNPRHEARIRFLDRHMLFTLWKSTLQVHSWSQTSNQETSLIQLTLFLWYNKNSLIPSTLPVNHQPGWPWCHLNQLCFPAFTVCIYMRGGMTKGKSAHRSLNSYFLAFLTRPTEDPPFLTHSHVIHAEEGPREVPHLLQAAHGVFPHILVWVVEVQELQSLPRGQFRPNLKQRLKLLKIKTGSEAMGTKVTYCF